MAIVFSWCTWYRISVHVATTSPPLGPRVPSIRTTLEHPGPNPKSPRTESPTFDIHISYWRVLASVCLFAFFEATRSSIFEFSTFTDSRGLFHVFLKLGFSCFFSSKISAILTLRTMTLSQKYYFNTQKLPKNVGAFFVCFFFHTQIPQPSNIRAAWNSESKQT